MTDLVLVITEEETAYKTYYGSYGKVYVAWIFMATRGDYGYLVRGDTEEEAISKALSYVQELEREDYELVITNPNYYRNGEYSG